ncbi:uncharacterized protein LOC123671111 [Harmonia axyridis]|uniref:uncharacterized protein LOC123671111 n=1 Tax=Harmonia axyridis TaxID=115357 RepID=UPI001E277C6D|nr:uncharacterized protein LOC123671111 [Harmonia axyridis]
MSNSILPHLLSDSPPPLVADDEDFEDEFGDFKASDELSLDNENPSTPSSLRNSKDYFPDTFADFHFSNDEKKYQIFDESESKSSTNILNSIPPDDYYSIWKQIENNIPDIIDNVEIFQAPKEDIDIPKDTREVQKSEIEYHENSSIDTFHNNINPSNVNSENAHSRNEENIENEVSSEENQESAKETKKEERNCTNSMEENGTSQSVELHNDHVLIENNSVLEMADPVFDDISNIFESKGQKAEHTLHTPTTDEKNYLGLSKYDSEEGLQKNSKMCDSYSEQHDMNEKSKIVDSLELINDHVEHTDKFTINNHIEHTDMSPFHSTGNDHLRNFVELNKTSAESHNIDDVPPMEEEKQNIDDDFGEFADFSSCTLNKNNITSVEHSGTIEIDEDFPEFESHQKYISTSSVICNRTEENPEFSEKENSEEIDEFDDFTSYSAQNTEIKGDSLDKVLKICETPEEALNETQNVLKKIFLMDECSTADYSKYDYTMNNSVFENLKDITESNALTYQWGKSVAQKNILKTLNIDIRNILYGPSWNSGVPIFAANLCSKPLEPIKSEFPIPTSPQKNIESQEFDWSGSGLSNLQDSVGNADTSAPPNLQELSKTEPEVLQPSNAEGMSTSTLLSNFGFEMGPLEQLESTNNTEECETDDDFSDFTSHQGTIEKEMKSENMLPLRESHISSNSQQDYSEMDKVSIYFKELTMGKSEVIRNDQLKTNSKVSFDGDDSLKVSKTTQLPEDLPFVSNVCKEPLKISLEPFGSQNDPMKNNISLIENIRSNNSYILADDFSSFEREEIKDVKTDEITVQSGAQHQEDEFTDFQSSLPKATSFTGMVLLEPLKPSILQPEPVQSNALKIEWPEPGLDESEINRIVNGVCRKNSTNENVETTNNVQTIDDNSKQPIQHNDQDEWSDFMSVKQSFKTRTSTPDLPLSVFNLGSIQPNKVSAPYVAPNGVVHSPSKTPTISFPVVNRNSQNNTQQYSHQRPFITSQAFNALYSTSNYEVPLPSTSIGGKTIDQIDVNSGKNVGLNFPQNEGINYTIQHNTPSSISHRIEEDDDWGDFVSAPNTISQSNSSANFFQPSTYMNSNFGFISKSATIPKTSTKSNVVHQDKNNLHILSTMPDLDFVSSKSRSTIK